MKKVFLIFSLLFCSIAISQQTYDSDLPNEEICLISSDFDTVTATVYNAVVEQCNEDPSHTAFMFELDLKDPYKHRIIALSRDLLLKYPKGTRVNVTGTSYDGIYIVMDKMNKRYTSRIDILINQEMAIGKWDNVKIYKLDLAT